MESTVTSTDYGQFRSDAPSHKNEAFASGVAWSAVLGGSFVTAALGLILLALGTGLGLSAISPWSNAGVSASTLGTGAIVCLILIEVISSALGGYLTGRLRTKWATVHTDEVYFRDTANGFLAWAVALVLSVTFMAAAGASMVGDAAQLRSSGGNTAGETSPVDPNAYFVDTLFRTTDHATAPGRDVVVQAEAGRIFANALRQNEMPAADQSYLAELIAARTGISKQEADRRISQVMADARQTADTARKVMARVLLWSFLALLMGAVSASYAATIGGRQRDHVRAI